MSISLSSMAAPTSTWPWNSSRSEEGREREEEEKKRRWAQEMGVLLGGMCSEIQNLFNSIFVK